MKSKMPLVRNIVILTLVIAVLSGLLVWVMNVEPEGEDTPTATLAPSYTAYKVDREEISGFTILNGDSTLKVGNPDGRWTINGLAENEISADKVESLMTNALVMISSVEIDANGADLAEYGLDTPSTTITVNKKDGSTDTLLIGDTSPVSGEYFFMVSGADKIYTIYAYKVDSIRQPISYYKTFSRFNADITKIDEIILKRKNKATIHLKVKDVDDQKSYNVWNMKAPYEGTVAAIDQYVDDKILTPISNLDIGRPAEEKSDYGFDSPNAEVTMIFAEYGENGAITSTTEQKLIIGNTENNMSYVKIDGYDEVYSVDNAMLDFVYVDEFLVVSKLQGMADIAYTSKVTVEANGKTSVMEIGHPSESEFTFKINGKDADESKSKKVYQSIIALYVDGIYNGETLGNSEVTVTYTGYNGAEDTVVEYIPVNELSYALRKNGVTQFTIKKSAVKEMLDNLYEYEENPTK